MSVAGAAVGATSASSAAPGADAFTRPAAWNGDLARRALASVADHSQAVRAGDRQAFTVSRALVDPDGTSHVRLARTYAGLPFLGGDLVVHQAKSGAWEGHSQSLDRDLTLSTQAAVARAAAGAAALATSAITRSITGERVSSSRPTSTPTAAR